MNREIEHGGWVVAVSPDGGAVDVNIYQSDACAGCHAHSSCMMSEQKVKTISLPTGGLRLSVGDRVTVTASVQSVWKAVRLAYLYPLILLISVLGLVAYYTEDEALSGLLALLSLVPYYILLYIGRKRWKREIVFRLKT